jgi:predicted RNA polymerase sigma factor
VPDVEGAIDEDVGDDLLRLVLITCHPVLSTEARVALTLRLLGGLTTDEIARAFLLPEPTIAQRIVRAKRTLAEARVPFEVPRGADLSARLPSVHARRGPRGEPILLFEQDRSRWDRLLIRRGLAALERAESLAQPLGPYALQAAIAACHARAPSAADTDWPRIVALYDALVEVTQSPVVALNRAVAVAMAFGPDVGLELVDELAGEPALQSYHLLPGVRGDLLARLGRHDEARRELEKAASLTQNLRERELLLARARECGARGREGEGHNGRA